LSLLSHPFFWIPCLSEPSILLFHPFSSATYSLVPSNLCQLTVERLRNVPALLVSHPAPWICRRKSNKLYFLFHS
jgi:hypothetical protein